MITRYARYWLFASAFVVAACSGTPTPMDGGIDAGKGEDCFEDADCPDPSLFFCNTTTSKCEPACRAKTDCSAETRGKYALAFCDTTNGKRGCECDEGKCVGSLCGSDSDCAGYGRCSSGK